ncbi:MAG: hypothetical protein HC812_08830 [Leptolyngbya sp. RL_3_1]|nr:hypothetical protein [Leptolyngbya sp. RL_3_1]
MGCFNFWRRSGKPGPGQAAGSGLTLGAKTHQVGRRVPLWSHGLMGIWVLLGSLAIALQLPWAQRLEGQAQTICWPCGDRSPPGLGGDSRH